MAAWRSGDGGGGEQGRKEGRKEGREGGREGGRQRALCRLTRTFLFVRFFHPPLHGASEYSVLFPLPVHRPFVPALGPVHRPFVPALGESFFFSIADSVSAQRGGGSLIIPEGGGGENEPTNRSVISGCFYASIVPGVLRDHSVCSRSRCAERGK